jgi:hypothetical protein
MATATTENAYVIVHFGSNAKYLEMEIYTVLMLNHYKASNIDIVYLYSINDTPDSFIEMIQSYGAITTSFDDKKITYDIEYNSKYTSFNTLRTCNFIFAYNLTQYKKICIIESDMIIMGNIDGIFHLNTPSVLSYHGTKTTADKHHTINENIIVHVTKEDVLKYDGTERINGGIMLIKPNNDKFNEYLNYLPTIIANSCKYPNEALFESINNRYYNLPMIYNCSHWCFTRMNKYPSIKKGNVLVYHFNEVDFKCLDILKNPTECKPIYDENNRIIGERIVKDWYKTITLDLKTPRNLWKKIPLLHFEKTFYIPHKDTIMQGSE